MMVRWTPLAYRSTVLALGSIVGMALPAAGETFPAEQIEFFEKNVRPLLTERCHDCHGAHKHENGLRLDSRDALLKGSDYGKVVEPGNPAASKLIRAVKRVPGLEPMPKKGDALKPEQVAALEKWIAMGLPWPEENNVAAAHGKPDPGPHWAFQPIQRSSQFGVRSPASGIDEIIGRGLKAAGLDYAPPASPEVLVRRLHLTITGLLPTYEQVRAFVEDRRPDRTARLVDELLATPHYGERWGRYWLDVARYSDTEGYTAGGRDNRFPHAYTYRNWVIQALNNDMPYDQFITYQLAADKLVQGAPQSAPGTGSNSELRTPNSELRHLAALGFLTVNDRFLGDRVLQNDDRIDVIGRGLLGLTIGCGRCHDHKYDPITSKDYYALYSVFNSSEVTEDQAQPIIGQPGNAAAVKQFEAEVSMVEAKMNDFRREVFDDLRKPERLRDYLVFAQAHLKMEDTAFRGAAGKEKLRDRVADRWRDFLNRFAYSPQPHPVMLAWREFSALPADQFAAKAGHIVAKLQAAPPAACNSEVAAAFKSKPAPQSFGDVALTYAGIFLTHLAAQPEPNPQKESIRKLMQSGQSPMSVGMEGIENFFTRKDREHMTKFENEIKALELKSPGAPLRAMAMLDKAQPSDVRVMIRGNPARQGEPAPRAYLSYFGGQKFTEGSGRLELARLIASRDNPLTARVIVNRVWMQHFGKPLVSQPSDFGVQTPKPEQADLLDFLAATFMEEGWSLKKLHRRILNSRAWQQSCLSTPDKDARDADNNLISRMNRLRLDYEAMRDCLLQTTGALDAGKAGGRPIPLDAADASSWRSVYLLVDRYEQPTVPAMFDFANPDSHSPQRFVTTVPQQALFLMNSPFLREQSARLASTGLPGGGAADAGTIQALYRRVLLRDPKPEEIEMARRFLNDAAGLQGAAPFRWSYGTMHFSKDANGRMQFTDWQPFKVLNGKHGSHTWSHTGTIPDKVWHYAMWHTQGGHAGAGDIAPVLRWTAPADDTIRVLGKLKKDSERGNGVRGWMVSSLRGVLKEVLVHPASEQPVGLGRYEVKQGEILSFVVGSEGDTNSDSFNWAPEIHRLHADGTTIPLTHARTDFCGADGWPLNRPRPQNPLAQFAQVLLMSNEFQFVD